MDSIPRMIRSLVPLAVVALLLCAPAVAEAQATGSITGMVTDATSGRPLSQAQVSIPGTGRGALTNDQGRYLVLNVPVGERQVRVELIGYTPITQSVTITADATVQQDFQLSSTAISLDEIVVTGVGRATERRRLGTTVEVIDERAIEAAPVTNVGELLQGRVAGANVSATSAQPGTGTLINFRGTSSVFASQTPVIYVDGVRVDNDMSTAAGTGGEQSSALADLLTTDIERIEITKGGAASTLYGSDAATGVIQIFTKKGRPGDAQITVRAEQGLQRPELKYIFDSQYIFPDLVEDGVSPTFMEDKFFQTGHVQNYYLGVSGGDEDATYLVSGRLETSEGVQRKNENTIYSLRGSLQATPNEKLTLNFAGSFTRTDYGRLFNGTAIADPLTTFEVGDALFFSGASTLDEAFDIFLLPDINEEVTRWIFSAGADYVHNDRLSLRASVGLDNRGNHQRTFEPIGFTPGEPTGELLAWHRNFQSVSLDAAASYAWPQEGAVTSTFTVGAQGFREDEEINWGQGTTFALPGAEDFDDAAEIDAAEGNSEIFNGGVYLDEQIGLWNKLFLGAGVRFDAGSVFGDEVDVETYPKGTLAYLLSEESFFEDAFGGFVDEFRLRAAYGSTGKFPPPFAKDLTFSATSFRGESAPRFDNPGNEDLRPEITTTLEGGFDIALLNNRLGLNFTYFDATTEDALIFVPEQPVTGQGTQLRNVGEISNKGVELGANLQILNTEDVAWSLGATYNAVDNEMVDMGSASPFGVDGGQKRVAEGAPVGSWFVTHPHDSNGDGLFDASRTQYIQTGGSCTDAQLTGVDPMTDACEVAQVTPTSSGSFNTAVTLWNRLNISVLADWARGHHVMDWGSVWATFNGILRRELVTCGADFLPGDLQDGVGDCQRFPVEHTLDGEELGPYFSFDAISAFIYEGDWLKLREIQARYTVPSSLAARVGASRGSVYGSVRNVAIWSKNKLIDPELNGLSGGGLVLGGESSVTLSPPRAFRFGVELVF